MKHSVLLLFVLATSCKPNQQPAISNPTSGETKVNMETQLVNNWKFIAIEDSGGNTIKEVSETDSLFIFRDKSFRYDLAKPNIHAFGEWNFEENILSFTYHNLPKSDSNYTRQYFVQTLNDKNLVLVEKGIRYKFRR
ncbi:MAG: hypothetical protein NZ108_00890 [Bacteroidia bacterium]|nr:hypothetical protein [Bacteroidia bacterium]